MKKYFILCFIFLHGLTARAEPPKNGGRLKFVENKRQWNPKVLFRADLNFGKIYLLKDRITFLFFDTDKILELAGHGSHNHNESHPHPATDKKIKAHAYSMVFSHSQFKGIETTSAYPEKYHYYQGSDTSKWAVNAKAFREVTYKNLYPNIDLRLYQKEGNLKYDFVLRPGANVEDICIRYEGLDSLKLSASGLRAYTSLAETLDKNPVAYRGGKKTSCRFRLQKNDLRFSMDPYDRQETLVIDPEIIFSSYSGSKVDNWGNTAAYDSDGAAYAAGTAFGVGFPTTT